MIEIRSPGWGWVAVGNDGGEVSARVRGMRLGRCCRQGWGCAGSLLTVSSIIVAFLWWTSWCSRVFLVC
jgi:hypothetical protein